MSRLINNKEMLSLVLAAEAAGWTITVARGKGNHLRFQPPEGAPVFGPATPSDHRSWLNVRSKLRRAGLAI